MPEQPRWRLASTPGAVTPALPRHLRRQKRGRHPLLLVSPLSNPHPEPRLTPGARWLLLFDTLDTTTIAYTVGYESASQFNREYARLFGLPSVRDAARFKMPPPADALAKTP